MMSIATINFDKKIQKYTAVANGVIVAKANGFDYLLHVINNGLNQKAKKHGVTKAVLSDDVMLHFGNVPSELFGEPSDDHSSIIDEQPINKFSINERFDFVEEFTSMIATGPKVSLLLVGRGGIGKSHTVTATMNKLGLQEVYTETETALIVNDQGEEVETEVSVTKGDYVIIKGYSTAKSLFRTLYEHNGRTLIFDDCDVFKHTDAVNILKAAMDSYETRKITWNSENPFSDLPRSFIFTGKIIFISNVTFGQVDQALRTRATCIDLTMSKDELIERMAVIIGQDSFQPNYSIEIKQDALNFIAEHVDNIVEFSLRTLIEVIQIRASASASKWKRMALYAICQG